MSGRIVRVGRAVFPAGARRAAHYFVSHLLVAHRRRDRWLRQLGRLLPSPLETTLLMATGRSDNDLERSVASAVDAAIEAAERTGARVAEWLMIGDYAGTERQANICFLFDSSGRIPSLAARVRADDDGAGSEHEHAILRLMQTASSRELRATVPEPVAFDRLPGRTVLLTTVLPGVSGYVRLHRSPSDWRRVMRDAAAAAEWLGHFHSVTRSSGAAAGIGEPRSGSADVLAPAVSHGDFWLRNVLYVGGRVSGVVDWEHAKREASPRDDLQHLMQTTSRMLEAGLGEEERAAIVGRYAAAAGADAAALLALLERPAEATAEGQARPERGSA